MSNSPLTMVDISSLQQEGDTLSFDYEDGFGRPQQGLIFRWNGQLFAYKNNCPHWSTPLDEEGDDIFDRSCGDLICQTHGARFEAHSGVCVSGPCLGQKLEKLKVEPQGQDRVAIGRLGLKMG